jgi:hypothetical protein
MPGRRIEANCPKGTYAIQTCHDDGSKAGIRCKILTDGGDKVDDGGAGS